jgi:hypothetical protein
MFTKRVVITLVIIALVLAVFSISLNAMKNTEKISSVVPTGNVIKSAKGSGEVGVTVLTPSIEDKNA